MSEPHLLSLLANADQGSWLTALWVFISANWAITNFLLVVLFGGSMWFFITAKYVRIMLNVLRDTPPPLLPHTVRTIGQLDGETVDFQAFDGVGLRGQWVRTPLGTRRKGCVVFCHEYGLDSHSATLYAAHLLEAGYDLFTFDFRNHGESGHDKSYEPRQWCEEREVADAMGAFAYVATTLEEEGYPVEFGVLGISRGACAAMLAAPSAPGIKAMVCDGLFTTDRLWEHYAKRWAYIFARVRFSYEKQPPALWQYLRWCLERVTPRALNCRYPSVLKALRRTRTWRPTFFIHGQLDNYVPLDIAQEIYDAAPAVKYQWVVAQAKHNQAVVLEPAEYRRRVQAFFHRHLAGEDSPIRLESLAAPSAAAGA